MKKLFEIVSLNARKQIRRRAQPEWCNPMLATLVREQFSNKDWIFEPITSLQQRMGRRDRQKSQQRVPHKRSIDWLKFECENQQEFVIVGYIERSTPACSVD